MLGIESDIGGSALRLWTAAGAAALLVFVCAVAFEWARTRVMARIGVVIVGAGLGATLTWAVLDAGSYRDRTAQRQALENRAAELGALALTPGSALACLDGLAGATVEAACEKAIFASPAAAASATSYVAARLALLADTVAFTKRGGGHVDDILVPLRHALETDRYGFVAQVLTTLHGCSAESCEALSLLQDASRVRANLSAQVLDHYLDRYAAVWAQPPETPVADAATASSGSPNMGLAGRKPMLGIDFPTAASIPPVSIMNPEPKNPAAAAAAVAAGADTSAQAMPNPAGPAVSAAPATKRAHRQQAAGTPAPAAATPPPPLAVAPVTSVAPADPVWTPGATLAAPQLAATPSQ